MARNFAALDREVSLEGVAEGMRPRRGRRWGNPRWGEEGPRRKAVQRDRGELPEGEGQPPSMSRVNPEEAAAAPRRQRGSNMDPGNVMGSSGRQERTVNGRTYLMDGGWMVDKEALAPYGYDPDAAPPEVVEANRVGRAQLRNMAARGNKQAAWRANSQAAQQFSQQFGGTPYFAGVQGLRKAREMGLDTEALVDDEGGDLALYLLNNQISLAQKPDGTWGFINTGHDPRDPNAQWVGAGTGAGGVASGLNWETVGGAVDPNARQNPAPTTPTTPAPTTGGATKVVNGILYVQQPDGTWVSQGPAPTTPTAPATDPASTVPSNVAGTPGQSGKYGGINPQAPPAPAPAPKVQGVGGLASTIQAPPTTPQAPKMPANPMQNSVSSYIGAPRPGSFGNSSQFKLPSIKPSPGIVKPQGVGMLPKMPGTSGKIGSF